MPNKFLSLLVIIFCINQTIFSMEPEQNSFADELSSAAKQAVDNLAATVGLQPPFGPPAQEKTYDAITNTIDAEINRQQQSDLWDNIASFTATNILSPVAGSACYHLIGGSAAKTMAIVSNFKTMNWNENIINALYEKNSHFKNAVDYYITRVLNSYQEVTCENVNKAVNSELEHPVGELNKFIPTIKKYIIDNALKQITHAYTMEFPEDHMIESFDLCEYDTVHLAATNSRCCDHVSIWNLLTGKLLRRIENKGDVIERVCFSPTGSQIAAAGGSTTDSVRWVKIWNPQCGSLLYTIPQVESTESLQYQYESLNNTLLNMKNQDSCWNKLEVWLLDKKDPEYRGCSFVGKSLAGLQAKESTSYKALHPCRQFGTASKLYVAKNICAAPYLCERIIINAKSIESLKKVEGTIPFVCLTDYEKTAARKEVRNKIEALSEKQLRLHATNKVLDENL